VHSEKIVNLNIRYSRYLGDGATSPNQRSQFIELKQPHFPTIKNDFLALPDFFVCIRLDHWPGEIVSHVLGVGRMRYCCTPTESGEHVSQKGLSNDNGSSSARWACKKNC